MHSHHLAGLGVAKTAAVQESFGLASELSFFPWKEGPLAMVLAGGRVVRLRPRFRLLGQGRRRWRRRSAGAPPARGKLRLSTAAGGGSLDSRLLVHQDSCWH
jgi:hypothetical protein